jgi:hypothetical protein
LGEKVQQRFVGEGKWREVDKRKRQKNDREYGGEGEAEKRKEGKEDRVAEGNVAEREREGNTGS